MRPTIRTLRALNATDRAAVLEGWEKDARETIQGAASDTDRRNGKRLMKNCGRWRAES